MIRPVAFRMNEQTAVNNYHQKVLNDLLPATVNARAQQEFDAFVDKLRNVGVDVTVIDDIAERDTPDSIFPNNWVSFHENKDVALYPMFAENRRKERREDVLDALEEKGYQIDNIVALDEKGRVRARAGRFEGIDADGAPRGLLFPAASAVQGDWMLVINLSLPITAAEGDEWEEDVKRWTIARFRLPAAMK